MIPPRMEVPRELESKMDEVITHYPVSKRSAVLPLLHLIQHHYRFIDDDAVNWVAKKLELEPIQVLEVVTFYPGFRQHAPGKFHIRVCAKLARSAMFPYPVFGLLFRSSSTLVLL